jgi:hypothetical protein
MDELALDMSGKTNGKQTSIGTHPLSLPVGRLFRVLRVRPHSIHRHGCWTGGLRCIANGLSRFGLCPAREERRHAVIAAVSAAT